MSSLRFLPKCRYRHGDFNVIAFVDTLARRDDAAHSLALIRGAAQLGDDDCFSPFHAMHDAEIPC